jgi:hypothetical protein
MTRTFAAAAILVAALPSAALAQTRAGDAALGAVSGALVLGPIGAAAGAVIGYTAGPAIGNSWGVSGHASNRVRRPRSKDANCCAASARLARAGATRDSKASTAPAPTESNARATATPAAVSGTLPPVQTLE